MSKLYSVLSCLFTVAALVVAAMLFVDASGRYDMAPAWGYANYPMFLLLAVAMVTFASRLEGLEGNVVLTYATVAVFVLFTVLFVSRVLVLDPGGLPSVGIGNYLTLWLLVDVAWVVLVLLTARRFNTLRKITELNADG